MATSSAPRKAQTIAGAVDRIFLNSAMMGCVESSLTPNSLLTVRG